MTCVPAAYMPSPDGGEASIATPSIPSVACGRAKPVLASEIETELPAGLRHIECMARVSAVAPIVEAVPHAGPNGDSLRMGLARLDRDTVRIARHRKRPGKHRPCAIDLDPCPGHVRLDQETRLLAAACGEIDQETQVRGQGNPDGIRGHPGSGRQAREVPLRKLARSPPRPRAQPRSGAWHRREWDCAGDKPGTRVWPAASRRTPPATSLSPAPPRQSLPAARSGRCPPRSR